MKNKKGFTLIELLGVILIIALLALILVPVVLNVISTAKENALKDSAYGLIDAADLYYANNNEQQLSDSLTFECSGSACTTSDSKSLSFKGSVDSGQVIINTDGMVQICITNGTKAVTNTQNGIVLSKLYATDGTCDGISLSSETEEERTNLFTALQSLDANTTLTSDNTIAELESALTESLSGTTATESDIVAGYTAWSNGNILTGTYEPSWTYLLSGLYGVVTSTGGATIPYTVKSGSNYLLTIGGAQAGVSSGENNRVVTFTNMTCTKITEGQYGASTYTYVQLYQYYCTPASTSVSIYVKANSVSQKWTYYSSMIELEAQ